MKHQLHPKLWALFFLLAFTLCTCSSGVLAAVQVIDTASVGDGLRTPVYEWRDDSVPPQAVMLALHGFALHGKLFDSYARTLAARGIIVYAPDLRGFGRTYYLGSERRVSYDTFADCDVALLADRLKQAYPNLKLYICGESMGASLSIRLAAMHPELVDGLILSAPGIKIKHHLSVMASVAHGIAAHGGTVDIASAIIHYASSDRAICQELAFDPLTRKRYSVSELLQCLRTARETRRYIALIPPQIPVLVLQSRDDATVSQSCVKLLRRRLNTTDLSVVLFNHKGHVLLETKYVASDTMQAVTDWLDQHVSAKESPKLVHRRLLHQLSTRNISCHKQDNRFYTSKRVAFSLK